MTGSHVDAGSGSNDMAGDAGTSVSVKSEDGFQALSAPARKRLTARNVAFCEMARHKSSWPPPESDPFGPARGPFPGAADEKQSYCS